MRSQFSFHARRASIPAIVLALSMATLLLSGCAALGGGVSQTRDDGERTSSEEPTTNDEPTMAEANESTDGSGEGSETVRAGDAEVATEGGSVVVRAGDAEVTTGAGGAVARAGDVVADANAEAGVGNGGGNSGENSASPENAELRLAGDEGTSFSGVCVVGGEPTTLEGEVPARLDYELTGGGLACEIGKEGPGLLRVALTAGESEVIRETNAEDAKIEIVYRDGNVIASTSSSNSSSSNSSSSSVTSSSQSSSSVSSSSSVQNQSSSSSVNQSVSVTN